MAEHASDKPLTQEQRMEVFLALVESQDGQMSVSQSRQASRCAASFG